MMPADIASVRLPLMRPVNQVPPPSRRRRARRLMAVSALSLLSLSCAARSTLVRQQCYDADAQLASALQPYEELRAQGCAEEAILRGRSECDRLREEIERLAVVCPAHAPTLMANAVIDYDEGRPAEAQQLLDLILSQPRPYADAAALRARIAIEEGNIPFALRLTEQHIKLVPDHSGLHETHAAALYLDGAFQEARQELDVASALGAPRWRIAYHLGLIEEAAGRTEEAGRLYAESLEGNPNWAPARSRLNALRAGIKTP